jgi:multimeric flavodoxin WrbA
MKSLLIVYHSMTGGTLQMAEAAAAGARSLATVAVILQSAAQTRAEHLLDAHGYVFATPENLAAISGQLKDFFDRTYYSVLGRLEGRPYAILVCAGSDGRNAAQQIERIATGWRLRSIAEPVIVCTHAQTAEEILRPKIIEEPQLRRCEELGATMAAGLELGIF